MTQEEAKARARDGDARPIDELAQDLQSIARRITSLYKALDHACEEVQPLRGETIETEHQEVLTDIYGYLECIKQAAADAFGLALEIEKRDIAARYGALKAGADL